MPHNCAYNDCNCGKPDHDCDCKDCRETIEQRRKAYESETYPS